MTATDRGLNSIPRSSEVRSMGLPFCFWRQWRAVPALQDKIRGQKTRFMLPDDVGDHGFVDLCLLGGHQGPQGKNPQGVVDRQRPLGGILASRKGEGVGPPL